MATFEQNLAIIRGGSNIGTTVRTAIADALLQSVSQVDPKIVDAKTYIDNAVSTAQTSMTNTANSIKNAMDGEVTSAVNDITGQVNAIEARVNATLRMSTSPIAGTDEDYYLVFTNAT